MRRVYVDGVDIKEAYGAFILNGGYAALLAYPQLKNIDSNDWMEEDGVEVDMGMAKVSARNIQIPFGVKNNPKGFAHVLSSAYRITLVIEDFGEAGSYDLIYNGVTGYSSMYDGSLTTMTVSFIDVNQTRYENRVLGDAVGGRDRNTLSGYNMRQFGWHSLTGKDGLWCEAARKPVLMRDIASVNNLVVADDATPMGYAAKTVTIKGLMKAPTARAFFDNYYSLFALLRSGVLTLESDWDGGEYYKVQYTGGAFSDAFFDDGVWALATLTFAIVGYE